MPSGQGEPECPQCCKGPSSGHTVSESRKGAHGQPQVGRPLVPANAAKGLGMSERVPFPAPVWDPRAHPRAYSKLTGSLRQIAIDLHHCIIAAVS